MHYLCEVDVPRGGEEFGETSARRHDISCTGQDRTIQGRVDVEAGGSCGDDDGEGDAQPLYLHITTAAVGGWIVAVELSLRSCVQMLLQPQGDLPWTGPIGIFHRGDRIPKHNAQRGRRLQTGSFRWCVMCLKWMSRKDTHLF
jgi:hypothetical protein